jgi:dipeptidyl aminopeptidase/acylaminoacyl peptidase
MAIDYESEVPADPSASSTSPSPWNTLAVVDLSAGTFHLVIQAPLVDDFGWSSSDQLIYTVNNCCNLGLPKNAVPLRAYDPTSEYSRPLIAERVAPDSLGSPAWSADHSALLLRVADPALSDQTQQPLALLTFAPTVALRHLDRMSDLVALSPDGRRVAFIPYDNSAGSINGNTTLDANVDRLNVYDVTMRSVSTIAVANVPRPLDEAAGFSDPRWSADGAQLAWRNHTPDQADSLLNAPAAGGPVRVLAIGAGGQVPSVDFSPDGRYLTGVTQGALPSLGQYWLFDRQAVGLHSPVIGWSNSIVWSPKGGRLVIAGRAGVSAIDPATGDYEWLGDWQNCQLQW